MYQERNMTKRTCTSALHVLTTFTAVTLLSSLPMSTAFMTAPLSPQTLASTSTLLHSPLTLNHGHHQRHRQRQPTTALNVWWFGGSESENEDESCELVAVRIERTSANSRRIAGDIIVPKPIDDVWAILTDYDNLSIHVPNLVQSKRVNPSRDEGGMPGDGSYECRLFQKGAQKIVGFEFGASVTMDMTETTRRGGEEKTILFKCVESQFFTEFDGEWKVTSTTDPDDPTVSASRVQYVVDVRPKGPVPVQALEWRIREDVPTNLRAVKAASIDLGQSGVLALRESQRKGRNGSASFSSASASASASPSASASVTSTSARSGTSRTVGNMKNVASSTRKGANEFMNRTANAVANATAPRRKAQLAPVRVDWYEDETMAAYLNKSRRR